MFAEEALKNDMFKTVFNAVDSLITSTNAEQYIVSVGSTLTQTDLNALILYIIERGVNPFIVCRSVYAQKIAMSEILSWSLWRIINCYKNILEKQYYKDSFEIFLVSGDKNIIENKHWLNRIKIRQENK